MLSEFLTAFFLTIIIETAMAFSLGFREKEFLVVIILINVITHPSLHYFMIVLNSLGVGIDVVLVSLLEIIVVFIEWLLLVYAFQQPREKFFLLSVITNGFSYLIGILFFW